MAQAKSIHPHAISFFQKEVAFKEDLQSNTPPW